jgi:flagellar basal body rod protein FlgG
MKSTDSSKHFHHESMEMRFNKATSACDARRIGFRMISRRVVERTKEIGQQRRASESGKVGVTNQPGKLTSEVSSLKFKKTKNEIDVSIYTAQCIKIEGYALAKCNG